MLNKYEKQNRNNPYVNEALERQPIKTDSAFHKYIHSERDRACNQGCAKIIDFMLLPIDFLSEEEDQSSCRQQTERNIDPENPAPCRILDKKTAQSRAKNS